MLKVFDHATGTSTAYATKLEALAAGRFLARQLAAVHTLDGLLEDPEDDCLLIYGTVQDAAGRIIDAPPLVRVSFPGSARASQRA
jgi:hypothetical protein